MMRNLTYCKHFFKLGALRDTFLNHFLSFEKTNKKVVCKVIAAIKAAYVPTLMAPI